MNEWPFLGYSRILKSVISLSLSSTQVTVLLLAPNKWNENVIYMEPGILSFIPISGFKDNCELGLHISP